MDDSKEPIDAGVRWEKRSETDVIQDDGSATAESRWPEPRLPLSGVTLSDSTVAERVDELLERLRG